MGYTGSNTRDMKYLCDPHVVPTVVPATLLELSTYAVRSTYAGALHIDVADGIFAPNTTWPFQNSEQIAELDSLHDRTEMPQLALEVHMMVADPGIWGERFAAAGFKTVLGHVEVFPDSAAAITALDSWREAGATSAGLAINLETPLESLDGAIASCDLVHMMSIAKIGFQGQPFDERALQRVEELHAKYPDLLVAVDGGITEATVESLARAGANKLCVGSAISQNPDPAAAYRRMTERAMKGCVPLTIEMDV